MTKDEFDKLKALQEEWREAWKFCGDPRTNPLYEEFQKNQDNPMIQFANKMGRFSTYSNVENQLGDLLKSLSKDVK